MSTVTVTRDVPASADVVWALLRDFGNIAWIPVAGQVDVEGDGVGMRRLIHGSGTGDPVAERLTSVDDGSRTIEYAIVENNPLPVGSYEGRVSVDGTTDGSVLSWTATFEPAGDEAESAAVVELMVTTLAGWLADAAVAATE